MKRLFILASAAIVAFASCAKTEVVYNEAPQEIGFKAVTGMMTKADDAPTLAGHTTMGVFADRNGGTYFDNTSFTYDAAETFWTAGEDPKYWPLDGTLDFTVYAPFNNSVVNYESGILTITADNTSTETDWLYGTTQPSGDKGNDEMVVELAHALSLVEVNVTGSIASLKKVELLSTYQAGNGTVTYDEYEVSSVGWTPTTTTNLTLFVSEDNDETTDVNEESVGVLLTRAPNTTSHLVIPTTALTNEAIKLTYTLPGYNGDLVYTTNTTTTNDLGTSWAHGKKYVYNISISPNEIKFDPTVDDWDKYDFDTTNDTDDDPKEIEL